MKKLIIAFAISSFVTTIVNAQTISNKATKESEYEKNYKIIMISDSIQSYIKEEYNIEKTFSDIYPEYFGGVYISEDGQNVILQIVEKNIPEIGSDDYDIYNKLVNFDDLVKTEFVENSFNELNKINNSVSDYLISEKSSEIIIGSYVDVVNNKSVVEVTGTNPTVQRALLNDISFYRKKLKQSAVNYVQVDVPTLNSEIIKAGGTILGMPVDYDYAVCSMGFRTRFANKDGYVTAGHCIKGAQFVESGQVLYSQFADNGYFDYGFVATNNDFSPSNSLAFSSNDGSVKTLAVVNSCPTITVNMQVAKSGRNTHYTEGKVTGLNQTVRMKVDEIGNETVTLKGLVKTNLENGAGDSGAPVFIPRTDAEGGAIPLGVLSGGSDGFLGIGRTMYFTSINDMYSDIQLGRY